MIYYNNLSVPPTTGCIQLWYCTNCCIITGKTFGTVYLVASNLSTVLMALAAHSLKLYKVNVNTGTKHFQEWVRQALGADEEQVYDLIQF